MTRKILAIGAVSIIGKGDLTIYRSSVDQLKDLGLVKLCIRDAHTELASKYFGDIDLLPHPYEMSMLRNHQVGKNQSLLMHTARSISDLTKIFEKRSFLIRQIATPIVTSGLVSKLYPDLEDADISVVLGHTLEKSALNLYLLSYFFPKFILGKTTVIFPISVSRLALESSPKKIVSLIKMVLRNVDVIFLREEKSYEYLTELIGVRENIFQAADTAFLLSEANARDVIPKIHHFEADTDKMKIGVTLRSDYFWQYNTRYGQAKFDLFMKKMAKILDRLIEDFNAFVNFVPMTVVPSGWRTHFFDDLDCAKKCVRHMKHRRDVNIINTLRMNVYEIKTLLGLMDFLIVMRMHAGILSLSKNIPTVMILPVQDNKAVGVAERLGIRRYLVDLDNAIAKDSNSLYSIISEAINNYDAIRSILEITIPRERKLAAKPFRILKGLLK